MERRERHEAALQRNLSFRAKSLPSLAKAFDKAKD